MGVNNKIYVGTKFVTGGVDTLFGGGFNVALVGKVGNIHKNNVVGGKHVISHTAGSDNKLLVIYTTTDITPGSDDKPRFKKFVSGSYN